jgi:hypothetical protein
MAYQLIETVEVGSGGASGISFASIPQDGLDLVIVMSLRQTNSGDFVNAGFRLNATTRTKTTAFRVTNGDSVSSTTSYLFGINGSSTEANTFTFSRIFIPNYTSSQEKPVTHDVFGENTTRTNQINMQSQRFNITSGITSFNLDVGGTLAQYSTASLYTIS